MVRSKERKWPLDNPNDLEDQRDLLVDKMRTCSGKGEKVKDTNLKTEMCIYSNFLLGSYLG
jgi:hypothetical protein